LVERRPDILRRRRPGRRPPPDEVRRAAPSRRPSLRASAVGTDLDTSVPSSDPIGHIDCKTWRKVMMRRRDVLIQAAATCLAPALAGAQGAWPQRPVSLVVPFGAGGSADLVARMFAQHFQAKYGVSVIIENKGGAGGSIGSAFVAKAPPDGHTLVLDREHARDQPGALCKTSVQCRNRLRADFADRSAA
jgi:hypothetical protein